MTVPDCNALFEKQSLQHRKRSRAECLSRLNQTNFILMFSEKLRMQADACTTRERLTGIYGLVSSTSINRYHWRAVNDQSNHCDQRTDLESKAQAFWSVEMETFLSSELDCGQGEEPMMPYCMVQMHGLSTGLLTQRPCLQSFSKVSIQDVRPFGAEPFVSLAARPPLPQSTTASSSAVLQRRGNMKH